ncbi:iron-containing alcohol dehydrogenase family protein [Natronobiforma cellulositropha]|uniref:iron-containing alcohol dehydrogenase family protein n=1 Tax=Natronobiforma cellulositropha TaxID=1679076 RepID=UPI0021D5E13B|nr:iron-containing alcohol dehydrogenase family protein [Natronobiforma cellulositropha]
MTDGSRGRARPFRFAYDPAVVRFGSGGVAALEAELEAAGLERALVVCGSTVGTTPEVIDPVTAGLGDRLAGVFAETTPEKRLETAVRGLERVREERADALVAVGGGSSLDVAKLVSVLGASERSPAVVGTELAQMGTITVPAGPLVPLVAVPTTLAGADLSIAAGVTASPTSGLVETPTSGSLSDPKLMPAAVVYDPDLLATTPRSVLAASAMNGFDKGLETLYARTATPVTDATAARGLSLLADALPAIGEDSSAPSVFETALEGILLVQYGISRADASTLSVIHAFGHGLARTYEVQQGAAHAVAAPQVLRVLFEQVDGRRNLLAQALGVWDADLSDADTARAVVDAVAAVRDGLGLPTRLREVDGPTPEAFPAVAETIRDDPLLANAPPGFEPSLEAIESALEAAW